MNKILFTIWVVVAAALLLFISPRLTGYIASQLPDGTESTGSYNLDVSLAGFLDEYAQNHDQGGTEFKDVSYSCLMLADALTMEGFTADIAVGNTVATTDDGKAFDYAWVVVSGENETLAVDARTYEIVYSDQNPLYYGGRVFDGTDAFMEYVDLHEEHETYKENTRTTREILNDCTASLVNISVEFDANYGGRWINPESLEGHSQVFHKLGECHVFSDILESETRQLDYLEKSMSNMILSATEPLI